MSATDASWTESYTHIRFERREHGILLVTLDRPETGNAVNPQLHRELAAVWRDVDTDAAVSVAVLHGAGESFSVGGELGTFAQDDNPGSASVDEHMYDMAALVNTMIECRKPIIAAVHGLAMASGMALALSADISVVGENARLNDGHLRGGMVAGDHAALLWPLYTSLAKARYYLLTGESLSGREAERLGLVSLCVPDDEVLDRALAVAGRIATNAQYATRWTKKALNAWVRQQAPLFELSIALQMLTLHGADTQAAMKAFAQGGKPQFPSVVP